MKIMETMPAENWYNVEKDATQFHKYDLKSEKTLKELGHVIIDKVEHLAETPEYSKLFHVIVDYGVSESIVVIVMFVLLLSGITSCHVTCDRS